MRFLLMFFIVFCTYANYCACKDFTLKELKDGFKAQYIDKRPTASLDSMDVVYFMDKHKDYICTNPKLHQVGDDIILPKSKFVILKDDQEGDEDIKYTIYWFEPREDANSKANQKLRNILRKRYGSLEINDTMVLVPAKWFSGKIMWITDPYLYGNQYVSRHHGHNDSVKDGVFYNYIAYGARTLKWDIPQNDFRDTVWKLDCMLGNGRFLSPPPTSEELFVEKQLVLLSTTLNGYIDRKMLPFDYKSREFIVMLRRDETLKCHLYSLEDEDSLSTEERLVLTCISMAVEQLPAGIFKPLWCDRGLYPAIFLKVSLTQRGGCIIKEFKE